MCTLNLIGGTVPRTIRKFKLEPIRKWCLRRHAVCADKTATSFNKSYRKRHFIVTNTNVYHPPAIRLRLKFSEAVQWAWHRFSYEYWLRINFSRFRTEFHIKPNCGQSKMLTCTSISVKWNKIIEQNPILRNIHRSLSIQLIFRGMLCSSNNACLGRSAINSRLICSLHLTFGTQHQICVAAMFNFAIQSIRANRCNCKQNPLKINFVDGSLSRPVMLLNSHLLQPREL